MRKGKYVVGLGEVLWDVFSGGKKLGGAPANFAFHASQLGCDAYVVSAVGDDDLGKQIVDELDKKGLHHVTPTVHFPTSEVQVRLTDACSATYEFTDNSSWDNIPFTADMEEIARNTAAVCWGTLAQRSERSSATIAKFLDLVPDDALKIFDVNIRSNFYSQDLLDDSLKRCNVLKTNEEEIMILWNLVDMHSDRVWDISRALLKKYNLRQVLATWGDEGSYVFLPDNVTSYFDRKHVEVIDTVGAGDSFTAAYVAATIAGKSVAAAHEFARKVSAFVCTQRGAMPLLPEELKHELG
ncbi:MAG: carbohydrate kinase [Muribaculaceae bacterium]|jgi:fructokinase|nr:carbohydrate kinase [Muribaculaceae bacterium]